MNKKLIIFDIDGVLFNSKENMNYSWKKVKSVHKVKPDFKNYFKLVGLPFNKILFKLNIKKNLKEIEKTYSNESLRLLVLFVHFIIRGVMSWLTQWGK